METISRTDLRFYALAATLFSFVALTVAYKPLFLDKVHGSGAGAHVAVILFAAILAAITTAWLAWLVAIALDRADDWRRSHRGR
jgi:hypothetical protein